MARVVLLLFFLSLVSACSVQSHPPRVFLEEFTETESLTDFLTKAGIWQEEYGRLRSTCPGHPDPECIRIIFDERRLGGTVADEKGDAIADWQSVVVIDRFVVLLRHGRLFSFTAPRSGDTGVHVIDFLDIQTEIEDGDVWYDQVLSFENTIVVLGYDHAHEKTLIRLFKISESGSLTANKSYFLDINDSEYGVFGSRIVDGDLTFYVPRSPWGSQEAVSGEMAGGTLVKTGSAIFKETVYRPVLQSNWDLTLHSVARCPLSAEKFQCEFQTVVGPRASVFHASQDAVYLWIRATDWTLDYSSLSEDQIRESAGQAFQKQDAPALSLLYRIPFDGERPGVMRAVGEPANRFSFKQSDDHLWVVSVEYLADETKQPILLKFPLSQFDHQVSSLTSDKQWRLPDFDGWISAVRFLDSKLVYGAEVYGSDSGKRIKNRLLVKELESPAPVLQLELPHEVSRIEPVFDGFVVIGADRYDSLGVTSVRIQKTPSVVHAASLKRARLMDGRRFGLELLPHGDSRVFGLPVFLVPESERYGDFFPDLPDSVHMAYVQVMSDLYVRVFGELQSKGAQDNGCEVPCEKEFGVTRSLFIDGKPFAVLGSELIEGYVSASSVGEVSRADALSALSGGEK